MKEKNEMDFDFLTAEEDAPLGGEEFREPLENPGKKKTSRSRVLLLLLLLVVVAGAGYFYLLMPPVIEQQPPPPPPTRRPIAMPVKPPAAVPPQAAAPAPATATATATALPQVQTPTVPVKPAPTANAAAVSNQEPTKPAGPAATAAAPSASQAPSQYPAAAGKGSAVTANQQAPAPAVETAAPAAAKTEEAVPSAGMTITGQTARTYTIDVGAFLLKSNRLVAEKAIRRLGYEPQVKGIKRPVKMVRLRLGGPYTPMEAEAKLKEIAAVAPDSFAVNQGEEMVVYAGSYHSLDQARVYADRLYQQGIRVEEETAEVPMLLHLVTFGSFADKAEADEALAKARAAGLEATLLQRR